MTTINERDQLVLQYLPLAEKLAVQKQRTVRKGVQLDELQSAAYFGLLDAATKFDTSKNTTFPYYARWRINGEINDYLRKSNWGKRTHPMYSKSLDVSVYKTSYKNPSPLEGELVSENNFIEQLNAKDFFQKLTRCLPSKVRTIFYLYFIRGETMKAVSKHVELSESRVSQLIKQHLELLHDVWDSRQKELWSEIIQKTGGIRNQHAEFRMQYLPQGELVEHV